MEQPFLERQRAQFNLPRRLVHEMDARDMLPAPELEQAPGGEQEQQPERHQPPGIGQRRPQHAGLFDGRNDEPVRTADRTDNGQHWLTGHVAAFEHLVAGSIATEHAEAGQIGGLQRQLAGGIGLLPAAFVEVKNLFAPAMQDQASDPVRQRPVFRRRHRNRGFARHAQENHGVRLRATALDRHRQVHLPAAFGTQLPVATLNLPAAAGTGDQRGRRRVRLRGIGAEGQQQLAARREQTERLVMTVCQVNREFVAHAAQGGGIGRVRDGIGQFAARPENFRIRLLFAQPVA